MNEETKIAELEERVLKLEENLNELTNCVSTVLTITKALGDLIDTKYELLDSRITSILRAIGEESLS